MPKTLYNPVAYKVQDPADQQWKWTWEVLVREDHGSNVDEYKLNSMSTLLYGTEAEAAEGAKAYIRKLVTGE